MDGLRHRLTTKVAGNGYSPLLRSPRLPPTLPFLLFFQTLCVSAFIPHVPVALERSVTVLMKSRTTAPPPLAPGGRTWGGPRPRRDPSSSGGRAARSARASRTRSSPADRTRCDSRDEGRCGRRERECLSAEKATDRSAEEGSIRCCRSA